MRPLALLLALLLLLPFSAGPVAAAPTGRVYRLTSDLGVPADRGVNVADRISQAIDRLAPGDTLLFEGMYRVDWGARVYGVHGDIMRVADDPCRIPRCLHPTSDILFEDGYGYMPGRHAFGMVEGTRITVRRTKVE